MLCHSVVYFLEHPYYKFPIVSPHSTTDEHSEFSLAAAAERGDTTNLMVFRLSKRLFL